MQKKEKNASVSKTDMNKVKIVHFVGIGGCGMSAIAKILIKKGYKVTGSDIKESANTIRLRDLGIKVYIGHDKTNVRGADLTVSSSAIPAGNAEVEEALSSGIPTEKRAAMLSWIMDQFKVRIAVAGTHGKTTTTSMIATVLSRCEKDPTFLIGGEANDVDGNARMGAGPYVVAEADESDGSFLTLHPTIAVITNVEADHMEYFGSFNKVVDAFSSFAQLVPDDGVIVMGGRGQGIDDVKKNITNKNIITYGLSDEFDFWADNFKFSERRSKFDAHKNGRKLGGVTLCVPGNQNIENALAAIAVTSHLNCDFSGISSGLQFFTGAKRRFQLIGETKDIIIVDDYGHHPTEVAKTLEAARLGYQDRRIICIFQPHRFTRTMHLYEGFRDAFNDADITIISDIYSAGEAPISGISGETIFNEVKKNAKNAVYMKRKEQISNYVMEIVRPGDLIITMGAGDINNVGKEIFNRLKENG
ncbi:MAG: UDP-N-acetylmuramate--L-alanine ligase [bacterium]